MTAPASQPPPEQPPVVGYTPQQLEAAALPLEAATAAALVAVAAAASRLITAPAGAPAGVAGAAFVTLDDLAVITRLWVQHTDRQLMPILRNVFHDSAGHVHGQIGKLLAEITELPPGVTELPAEPGVIPDVYAEDLMVAARNRLVGIGDVLWANARQQLADGMREGESIPQLAQRVRAAAGVSEPRATVIARTEVISTSNGASIAQARSAGVPLEKQWMATDDNRTRPTHVVADGQLQPMGEPFIVGGALLDFPGDPAGPPGEVINCRCSIGFHVASDITTAAARVRKLEGEALAEFNRKHARGPGGRFGSGGVGAVKQAVEAVRPRPAIRDVAKAKERLANAEKMFGTDRSKWKKRDRDLAERFDQFVAQGELTAPAPAARPKRTAKTQNRSLNRVSAKQFDKSHGGIANEKKLSTRHNASDVHLITFADGSKVIAKASKSSDEYAKGEFDAEQLAALVGDVLNLKPPAVYRTDDGEAYFDYINTGQVAASVPSIASSSSNLDVDGYFDTLDGRRIGLLDTLIENPDRHQGNWIVHEDGSITPIDHGLGWERATLEGQHGSPARPGSLGAFTDHYIGERSGQWRDNDLSPEYVKQLRTRLAALKPQFEQLDQADWHKRMMLRFDIIASHAKGDVTL